VCSIKNPISKEVTVQVCLAVPLYESPDSKESGLFYASFEYIQGRC